MTTTDQQLTRLVAAIEAETTVSGYLLLEDKDFLAAVGTARNLEELITWVNENY
jgi:hypothetical protein